MKQDIDTASYVPHYPLGFRMADGNRVYHYAKAGGELNTDIGAKNTLPQMVSYCPVNAAPLGAKVIVLTIHNTDGRLGDGVIGADELQGGYINIFTHEIYHPISNVSWTINRMIVHNTPTTGVSLVMTVTLDKPLPVALTGGNTMHAEAIASPYARVMSGSPVAIPLMARMSVVGYPTRYAVADQYLWLQTWGPVWGAPGPGDHFGDSDNNRELVFNSYGAVDYITAYPLGQRAGFVMCNALAGTPGVAIFFLQLDP